MKRLALVASVFVLAACSAKDTATTDSTAAAMAPAPAPAATMPMDTGMKADTGMMKTDTMKSDTTKHP